MFNRLNRCLGNLYFCIEQIIYILAFQGKKQLDFDFDNWFQCWQIFYRHGCLFLLINVLKFKPNWFVFLLRTR